ncbi:flagellar biosynthesis anti-sigma factor FlgM [Shewanella sp. NFH-SH190041]|uniref:flagellar biosynthesis anti-sigma factor FlgM n=1 Tax=Shewanella sp. NFH-SH190041 TaxID=2950245 RepID=UPI0021C2CD5E|nr:flagellar biosynthesis anti-sigma factor FlgM [Shewanella sp. NFH-SH190041]BDM63775.1 flagellar biosynthesis anti-sigma factor FlgM [Shewanella sp. NFH-SH190041]
MAIDSTKLNNAANSRPQVTVTPQHKTDKPAQATQNNAPAKSDSVSFTPQAQQLKAAQGKMAGLPEIDQKKVADIKLAIAEGRYKVDPEKLAANIVSFEKELQELHKD